MQTNNIFILVNNDFTNIIEKTIKLAKIMIKDLISVYFLKFNNT